MKRVFKRLFKMEFFRRLICFLAAGYIRFAYHANLHSLQADEATQPYMRGELSAVFAFWHGRMLLMPMICPPKRKMNVLISTHRDGEMIARTMHNFGFATPRGSSTRGGITATMQSVKALQEGENVSMTPDGPKGPAMKVQQGAVSIAAMAGVPVIPVTFSCTRHKRMRTWDRFMIALPFGRVIYRVGAPMMGTTAEALEQEMIRLTEETDRKTGVET